MQSVLRRRRASSSSGRAAAAAAAAADSMDIEMQWGGEGSGTPNPAKRWKVRARWEEGAPSSSSPSHPLASY
jgi:hypothetical protein